MKRTFKTLILFLFLFISFRLAAQAPPAQTIPVFEFYKLDKTPFTNKNLAINKPLFFIFFDPDCEHCQHAMTKLNLHYDDYKKAAIYLISLYDKERILQFLNTYAPKLKGKPNIALLRDTKNEFITRFLPRKYPSMFLYAANKKLVGYEDDPESMFRFSNYLNAKK